MDKTTVSVVFTLTDGSDFTATDSENSKEGTLQYERFLHGQSVIDADTQTVYPYHSIFSALPTVQTETVTVVDDFCVANDSE